MRYESYPLEVPASVASGAALDVHDLTDKTIAVSGTFAASIQIEGSLDGSTWIAIGAPISAPALVEVSATVAQIRASTTAYTSGTPSGIVAGRNRRTL